MSLTVALIPAYCPDDQLPALIEKLRFFGFTPLVIDDGSGEEYTEIFKNLPEDVTVLTHEVNRGKGAALRTGLAWLQDKYAGCHYTVVTLDADGQHLPADALSVCRAAEEDPDALVLGCRQFEGHVPFLSRLGNGITHFLFRAVTGTTLTDTQTGLRGFSEKLIPQMLEIPGDRYEYEMNVILITAKGGIPIEQLPIRTVYLNNNSSSHFRRIRDSFRIYREIFRFAFRHHKKKEAAT